MKILDDIKLDFSDVLLLPKRSDYSSRSQVSLERTFKFKYSPYIWTGVPIMVSNMDTTGTIEMALELQKHKVLTCLHKYYTVDDFKNKPLDSNYYAVSTGINPNDLENLNRIMKEVDPMFICIDVANGYMSRFIETCAVIRSTYPNKILIAGNVCTSEGVLQLVINGKVDIVKVGIGSGSCCTTRKQTGIGMPQLSAEIECADTAHGVDAHIISDGGSMFAGHYESGGELIEEYSDISGVKKYKVFYGMSSTTAMDKYSGGVAKYRSSEGKTVKIEYRGLVENTILDIQGGIRSCMTYLGAKKIKDLPKCATFIRVNRQLNQIYNGKEI
jgi:GMP reductase